MLSRQLKLIAAAVAAAAVGGGAYGIVSATAGGGSATATTTVPLGQSPGRGSNARSGPAAGGTVGTVSSVSAWGFTVRTSAGQVMTVKSSKTVKKGAAVLVLGTTNGTTMRATHVIVQKRSTSSSAVVPFRSGAPSVSKQVGQVPASYQQGSGTIVSGAAADKATEAALATYPGGIVDRVVKLSDGQFEVHNIGVNWPHHVFVSKGFKVVGAM
jgi:hypothetical protein